MSDAIPSSTSAIEAYTTSSGLRKVKPYWYPHTTMAKERWWGRELLEVVSTEFRERSTEYYRHALESGVTTINGKPGKPDTVILNGDLLENVTHRHEPPVTADPVRVVHRDDARSFIVVDKPGSIPVHSTGRYFKNCMVEILKDQGVHPVYTVNRLDRLTSGLLILPTTAAAARTLTDEFVNGGVKKEYLARCLGRFPSEEVTVDQPLLTVDRQMGLNIVHPEGKHATTLISLLSYDPASDTSLVRCRPLTGRSHQIRVHLQWLGHPIANDPVYGDVHIWGPNLGKGGVDLTPSDDRSAPAAPVHLGVLEDNPETSVGVDSSSSSIVQKPGTLAAADGASTSAQDADSTSTPTPTPHRKLLPRETGHDIGSASPVPLSLEAVGIITRLRSLKDEEEDWARWRDVAFRGRGMLVPKGVVRKEVREPRIGRRGKGKKEQKEAEQRKAQGKVTVKKEAAEEVGKTDLKSVEKQEHVVEAQGAGNTHQELENADAYVNLSKMDAHSMGHLRHTTDKEKDEISQHLHIHTQSSASSSSSALAGPTLGSVLPDPGDLDHLTTVINPSINLNASINLNENMNENEDGPNLPSAHAITRPVIAGPGVTDVAAAAGVTANGVGVSAPEKFEPTITLDPGQLSFATRPTSTGSTIEITPSGTSASEPSSHASEFGSGSGSEPGLTLASGLAPTLTSTPAPAPAYCAECFLPLPPDPPPEKLYIFLHALTYTTNLGRFETDPPAWAREGWVWEGRRNA